jgi:2-oxo-4-hydroxy-4-carboxy-5-ureidoimidazoline decarboxylase
MRDMGLRPMLEERRITIAQFRRHRARAKGPCHIGRGMVLNMTRLTQLNLMDRTGFVAVCGPLFEHSPWIAESAWLSRPFASLAKLHAVLCDVVSNSPVEKQLALIRAHPDLVGKLAREGRLTTQSTGEQAAAGLNQLTTVEAEAFDRYNAAYIERFGFPFVICARENRKETILSAFPQRLKNSRDEEISTAMKEIFKIAQFRLLDAVSESVCP